MALRNHPRISLETSRRIQKIAKKMGFCPNPKIGKLMSELRSTRTSSYQSNLGYLTPSSTTIRDDPYYWGHYDGARRRAAQLGFKLETISFDETGPNTLARVLRARGIPGIVISGIADAKLLDKVNWERLSAVTVGFSTPNFHCVCNHQFHSMQLALEQLAKRNYRRVGLHLNTGDDLWSNHLILAAFLYAQHLLPDEQRVPHLLYAASSPVALREWIARYRPEAIISDDGNILAALWELGLRVPRDLGCVHIHWIPQDAPLAGVSQNLEAVGAAAIDLLSGLILRNETGLPARPQTMMIEGVWREGITLRKKLAKKG